MVEVVTTRIDADEYVPWTGDEVIAGEPASKVHWIRRAEDECNHGGGLLTMMPSTVRFTTAFNETLHMIEGEALLQLPDKRELLMGPGDITFLPKETLITWTTVSPLKLLFVGSR